MAEEQIEIFRPEDASSVDDVRRERYPLWGGKWCWVWGVTEREYLALRREARRVGPEGDFYFDEERYVICRFIECVRDSGERGARPIFNRREHYDWLLDRERSVIEGAVELSMRLSGELPEEQERLARFFGTAERTSSEDSSVSA